MIRERWRHVGVGKKRRLVRVDGDAPLRSGAGLQIVRDIDPYLSPLGTGLVGSRRARREELKRHDCIEVDPSGHPRNPRPSRPDPVDQLFDRILRD